MTHSALLAQARIWNKEDDRRSPSVAARAERREHRERSSAQAAAWQAQMETMRIPRARSGDTSYAEAELEARRSGKVISDVWEPLEVAVREARWAAAVRDLGNGRALSYAEVAERARRVGSWIAARVEPGATVGILAPNSATVIEAHFAIAGWAGCVALNCNPRLASDELSYCIEGATCRALVCDAQHASLVENALVSENGLEHELPLRLALWFRVTTQKKDVSSLIDAPSIDQHDYEAIAAESPATLRPKAGRASDDGAEMYYTSGTSGRPKGVVLSHEIVVLHALGCVIEHRLAASDVWLHAAPMFHLVDAYAMFAITWIGGRHVVIPGFAAETMAAAIRTHAITVSNVASTMVTLVLVNPAASAKENFTSLELFSCGGAPLARATTLDALDRFDCEFFLSYGMTESCGKISMSLVENAVRDEVGPRATLDLICSSGRPFSLLEVRVVGSKDGSGVPCEGDAADGDAVDVSPGTLGVGEVWIRGPTVFGGYLNNPKANAKAITKEGWFRTGDLATLNDHGYVTITDRAKDMILVGSENVYCVEVERVLHDHPGVKHACVYGVPDDALGERVKAAVMRKDEALTVSELRRHAASRLADFKVPSTIEFVTELPMTGSGKVAKAALKKRDAERAEARRAERAARRLKQSEDDQLAGHVYRIEWNLSPIASPVASSVPSDATWLLVREDGQEQLARELASKLTSRTGTGVSMISLNQTGDDEEDEAASLERGRSRLAAALTEIDVVRGVVVLATLEATAPLDSGMAAVTKSTRGAMRTLLAITQTLVEAAVRNVPVVVVTRGGADVRDSSGQNNKLAVPGYAVWGFCRSAAAEMPALAIKLVDLCPSEVSAGHDAEALYKEALAPTSSRESAWRRRQRLVPNLARFATTDNSSGGESLRQVAPGVHVVTGGTGGLGIEWARRLAAAGGSSATVILTSRRAVSAEVDAEVKGLAKQTKATILVQKADVSVAADAEALLSRANMLRAGSAMSVWHLAGVVDDGAVSNLSWSRFSKVLLPKVEGSLALHDAAATYRPDRFVMFSSIYGLLGSRELTHYGAANAFQDGLAAARAQLGLPGLAVSWGTWADAGMAHRFGAGFEAHVKATGMRFVPLGAGFATLSALSSQSQSVNHAAVLPADWAQYAKHRRALGGPHPLATKLAQDATASDGVGKDTTTTTTKAATPGAERRNASADRLSVLRDIATNAVKSLLGDDAPSQLDLDSPVSTLGLSSVHVVEFAILLGEALDMEISPTLIFECVSINGICGRVLADSEPSTTSNNSTAVAATRLLRKLESVRAGERVTVLMREVVRHVCGQVGEDANVDVDAPVATVGLSSIQVVELAVFLSAELDEAVSPTTFFEHVSISGVCTHLVDEVLALGDSRAPPQPTAVPLAREPPAVEEAIELQISSAACRLPGDVSLPSDLWHKVLLSGQDCVLDDPPTDRPHNGRASAYISSETLFGFDRLAFAISAAEAAAMDPQQRLMLECCAEALECGERRSTPAMPGGDGVSDVGVFAAIETSDYAFLHQRAIEDGSCANADAYCGTGWHSCVPPNRVSYLFDLRGPSIALNTACSSSLTCIAVARHSLHARECSAALVGGSNIQLQPNWTCAFLAAGMLSPTFRCRFGDDAADGYVRGEGVGVLLVEARKSGGGVSPLATVSGVGIGQDGRSNGLTAPNPSAQGAVLTSAYSAGGVGLRESVALIEAHGTGTRLGDPIELGALGAAGLGKPEERLLRCASIKTNIGHLEGCSGLAGLLKAILVQHQPEDIVPRSLHFKTPNTHVPWDRLRVSVVAEEDRFCPPLAAGGMQPAIGTSSFGFGGALGHVIISRMTPHAHHIPVKRCVSPLRDWRVGCESTVIS
ncbi:hypothetical protein CTAYLR_000746 [Chrysophaeum taylorii]|uniref:Polyketide synthase n=1 Tax=Chrysophaeum taylorii TaxID=2483200 RepID=A0AAD7UQ35_9STRA|nr:hypothetical protein CTAYLR_000746 [Chrysophaeum taylorii]